MTWTAISAILAALGLIFYEWLRNRDANRLALDAKNKALEAQAEARRAEERAENEKIAQAINDANDFDAAIGFLRGSFKTSTSNPNTVHSPGVAEPAKP